MTLTARDLALAYDGRRVIDGLDVRIPPGAVTVVVGPNGCGKSTLLRGLARLLRPMAGSVTLGGRDVWSLRPRQFARQVALLPQSPPVPEGITVVDLVGRGRHPHRGPLTRWREVDDVVVARAMAATDTVELADRHVEELSGGQRQRVWIALTLAQDTDIILLDEPTTYLDVAHQIDVLTLLHGLNRERGTTIVMVLHDLNLAARYGDHIIAMRAGRIVAEGTPHEVVDEAAVQAVFGLESRVFTDPFSATPFVVPATRTSGVAS
jgi:iron complex transport system ATP-binding protein